MECGTELEGKHLENEGMIPYCNSCEGYRFPVFNTAVSMIILNKEQNKILLIKQYGGADYILCAGYVNKGENAEQAAVREIAEELGLQTVESRYNKSEYFEKNNTLMLNFSCIVANECLDGITDEVDQAEWFSIEDAQANIKKGSLAQRFLEGYLEKSNGLELFTALKDS
jgi:NAD+ diphosphatase